MSEKDKSKNKKNKIDNRIVDTLPKKMT